MNRRPLSDEPPPAARRRVFLCAGDPSGDIHGALLVRQLRRMAPDVWCYGVCGPAMRDAGVAQWADSSGLSAIGIAEALPKVPAYWALMRSIVRYVRSAPPSALVVIDFPAFNVRLLERLVGAEIPTLYYFPPASWRREPCGAHEKVARLATRIATPFEHSASILSELGARAEWVGHPALDRYADRPSEARARGALSIPLAATPLALLPGARPQELRHVLPLLLRAARLARESDPSILPIVSVGPNVSRRAVEAAIARLCPQALATEDTRTLLAASRAAIAKSGTITLDAAVCGLPTVVTYAGGPGVRLQYHLMIKGRVRLIAAPNILLDRAALPEHYTEPHLAEVLAREALALIHEGEPRARCLGALAEVAAMLGEPGASERTARMLLGMLPDPR